jgi:apolipoprotein N-acyltransferase
LSSTPTRSGIWRARLKAAAPPFGLGLLTAAGQAPLGLWPLSILALVILIATLPLAGTPRDWGRILWIAGIGYFGAALFWIIEPFLIEPEIHGWMAPFALIGMSTGMAAFWAGAGWLAARLTTGRARLPALASLLVLLELSREWVLTGFPWAMLGHGLIGSPLMQLATLGGAGALSLLILLAALLPNLGTTSRSRAAGTAAALALIVPLWLWGSTRTALPPDREAIVRLVQPNVPQAEKWSEGNIYLFFFRLLDFSSAPADPPPDLILWPETAVPFLLEYPGDGLDLMADAIDLHEHDTLLGFGVQRLEGGQFFNSLAFIDRSAEVIATYDKHHLVPFGEYVPVLGALLGEGYSGFAAQQLLGYTPGPGPQVIDLGPLGRVLPLICYEAIFPRHTRTQIRPDWLMQITNDAWFGELTGPYQHLAQARLRAVEQGLPLLRVANTGISALIDARGGIAAELPLGATGYLDTPLPGALPPTLYARSGDWPLILILLALLGAAIAQGRRPPA